MSLTHRLLGAAMMALAVITVACVVAIDDEELAQTPVASPVAVTPLPAPTPAEGPSPAVEVTEDLSACGDADIEARLEAPPEVESPPRFDPIPFVPDAQLEGRLRALLGDEIESYSVVVKNLADGSGVSIEADRPFYAASLFKVSVMYEVYHQRSLGLLSFGEEMLVTPYYVGFDLGTRVFPVCSTVTIEQAVSAMMSVSDNTSAVMLQDRVGSRHINEAMAALGLSTTRLLEDDLPTNAGDMALLMEMIALGEAVDTTASMEMAGLLASEEIDNGLAAGVPEGTLVAHKTGNWLDATHDVGIVYSPATTYVIAVLSDKGFEDHANILITELSRAVWEYYNGPLQEGEGE